MAEGAELILDGRHEMSRKGFFLGPTILDRVTAGMTVGHEEIFGPVLSVARAATLQVARSQGRADKIAEAQATLAELGAAH